MIHIKISHIWFCLYLFFLINFTWALRNLYEIKISHHYLNLFSSVTLYDEANKEINIYGYSHYEIDYIKMDDELDFRTIHPKDY